MIITAADTCSTSAARSLYSAVLTDINCDSSAVTVVTAAYACAAVFTLSRNAATCECNNTAAAFVSAADACTAALIRIAAVSFYSTAGYIDIAALTFVTAADTCAAGTALSRYIAAINIDIAAVSDIAAAYACTPGCAAGSDCAAVDSDCAASTMIAAADAGSIVAIIITIRSNVSAMNK